MDTEFLYRRNAVLEALRGSRRTLYRLYFQKGSNPRQLEALEAAAEARGLRPMVRDREFLTRLANDDSHQGVVLEVSPFPYSEIETILAVAAEREELPLLLLLDLLHGPHNIGMLLRTAEIVGVHGVVVQDRRAPDITPSIVTYAAGATEHLHIARVTNLANAIATLKAADVWVAGLDIDPKAQTPQQIDLNRALALVVGHEGQGLRRRVHESCDFILQLPMRGAVESLNAAAAGAVALYAAWAARGYPGAHQGRAV